MRYLLYCIFSKRARAGPGAAAGPESRHPGMPAGVGGQPVILISNEGLIAALSEFLPSGNEGTCSAQAPEISHILDYERVVTSFFRRFTVIPMRYGCLFEKRSQVLRTLEERCLQYEALLKELEGCAEMVIRALIQDCGTAAGIDGLSNYQSATLGRDTSGPGREYLNVRMAHYAVEDRLASENGLLFERCREVFDGLFVKCKSEYPSFRNYRSATRDSILSMYFLIPRSLVETFCRVFKQFRLEEPAKLLLSGPWPPYNFVTPCG